VILEVEQSKEFDSMNRGDCTFWRHFDDFLTQVKMINNKINCVNNLLIINDFDIILDK